MMLLTSSKTCLRHPDSIDARENRDTVFCQMRRAMDLIHYVIKDGVVHADHSRSSSRSHGGASASSSAASAAATAVDWELERPTASSSLRHFSRLMEQSRPRFEEPMSEDSDMCQSNEAAGPATSTNSPPSSSIANPDRMGVQQQFQQKTSGTSKDPILSSNGRERGEIGAESAGGLNGRPKDLLMRSNSNRDRHHNGSKQRSYLSCDREMLTRNAELGITSKNDVLNMEMSVLSPHTREELMAALDKAVEKTQDFTDSAYTTHEHRENILLLCDRTRLELNQCLRLAVNMEQFPSASFDIDTAVDSVLAAAADLSNQLCMAVADQTTELGHVIKVGIDLVNSLRNIALNQEVDRLQERAERFHDYIDHIMDVILKNILYLQTQLIIIYYFVPNIGLQALAAYRTHRNTARSGQVHRNQSSHLWSTSHHSRSCPAYLSVEQDCQRESGGVCRYVAMAGQ